MMLLAPTPRVAQQLVLWWLLVLPIIQLTTAIALKPQEVLAAKKNQSSSASSSVVQKLAIRKLAVDQPNIYKFNYTNKPTTTRKPLDQARQQSQQVISRSPAPAATPEDKRPKNGGKKVEKLQNKRQATGGGSGRHDDPWFLDSEGPHPLQPYRFVYNIKGRNGQTEQYRQEVGDGKFLTGSYGYVLPDGIYRHVDYVADDRGFRAFIRTSEPGTANQNPADVVINSAAVSPGVTYAAGGSGSGSGSAQQQQQQDSPQAAAAAAANLSYFPSAYYSSSQDYTTLNQDLSQLPRRPPGDIVGAQQYRYNLSLWNPQPAGLSGTTTSYASNYFEPHRLNSTLPNARWTNDYNWITSGGQPLVQAPKPTPPQLPLSPSSSPSSSSSPPPSPPQVRELNNQAWSRQSSGQEQQPQGEMNNATISNLPAWRQQSAAGANGRPLQEQQQQQPIIGGYFWPSFPSRPPTGTTKLFYDQLPPLGGLGRNELAPKISYDIGSGGNNFDQRQRALHEAQVRAASLQHLPLPLTVPLEPILPNTHYVRPLSPPSPSSSSSSSSPGAAGGAHLGRLWPPTTLATSSGGTSAVAGESESHHTEEHHRHSSSVSQSSELGKPAEFSSHEHASGTKSAGGHRRQFVELPGRPGQQPVELAPPPPPQFGNLLADVPPAAAPSLPSEGSGGTKGGGHSQAGPPYHHQRHLDRLDLDPPAVRAPAPPEEPRPPVTPPPPPPATTTSTTASAAAAEAEAPQRDAKTAGGGVKGPTSNARQQWLAQQQQAPVRQVRMPEDFRAAMQMNDLRSMQNTIGLPQPPRLAAWTAGRSFALGNNLEQARFQLADEAYLARARKIDQLLVGGGQASSDNNNSGGGINHQKQVGGQASSLTSVVAATPRPRAAAAETGTSSHQAKATAAPADQLGAQDDSLHHHRRLATGPLAKLAQAEVELVSNELLGAAFNETFDARRLPASKLAAAKLQAEKVSELEKFQQRLRAQQLLLEQQTKQPPPPPPPKTSPGPPKVLVATSNENSQVSYDEEEEQRENGNLVGPAQHQHKKLAGDKQQVLAYKWLNPTERQETGNNSKTKRQSNSTLEPAEKKSASEFSKSLQSWPSLANLTIETQNNNNNNNNTIAAKPAGGATLSPQPPPPPAAPQPVRSANTINLDFINSVTALSVDQLNPFALASVNPAVQRQQRQSQQARPAHSEPEMSNGRRGEGAAAAAAASIGVATANARYFSSPELLAALDHHERRDTGAQLRSLLGANGVGGGGGGGGGEEEAAVAAVAPPAGRPPGWASNHRFQVAPTAAAGAAAPYMLSASSSSTRLIRDGFEVRDRAQQVDGHRFYEVVARGA